MDIIIWIIPIIISIFIPIIVLYYVNSLIITCSSFWGGFLLQTGILLSAEYCNAYLFFKDFLAEQGVPHSKNDFIVMLSILIILFVGSFILDIIKYKAIDRKRVENK